MELEISVPLIKSCNLAVPCTWLMQSAPSHHILKIHLIITLPSTHALTSGLCTVSDFLTKILYVTFLSPIRTTCPAFITFLDLTNWQVFGEEKRSWSSLMFNYPHVLHK